MNQEVLRLIPLRDTAALLLFQVEEDRLRRLLRRDAERSGFLRAHAIASVQFDVIQIERAFGYVQP